MTEETIEDVTVFFQGAYLKKDDLQSLGGQTLVTIEDCVAQTIDGHDGKPPETKPVLILSGIEPEQLPLNKTNFSILLAIFGSPNANDWKGRQVELYIDRSIMMGGKVVGGLRIREVPFNDSRM